jgi:hypothetical protein
VFAFGAAFRGSTGDIRLKPTGDGRRGVVTSTGAGS